MKRKGKLWKGKQSLRENLRRAMPALVRDYFAAGDAALQPGKSWEEMHRFRLLTKRFRYTLELFQPAYGRGLTTKIEQLKGLQTLLGDINDSVVTRGILLPIPRTERVRTMLDVRAAKLTRELRSLWTSTFAGAARRTAWERYLVQYACRARQAAEVPSNSPDVEKLNETVPQH